MACACAEIEGEGDALLALGDEERIKEDKMLRQLVNLAAIHSREVSPIAVFHKFGTDMGHVVPTACRQGHVVPTA